MSDLHAAIVAKIDEMERVVNLARHGQAGLSVSWPRTPAKDALIEFWESDPLAFVLRGLAEDRDILARHVAAPSRRGRPPVCTEDMHDLPCPEVLSVARRHGVAPVLGGGGQ